MLSNQMLSSFNTLAGYPTKKSALGASEEFKSFKGTYALRQLAVDLNEGEWRYYDGGPKNVDVLLCLPGASGTAESMFRLMMNLCPKGYRVIAAQHPPYYSINEFVLGMDAFLEAVEAKDCHIFGAALGGFLGQQYCVHRPKRVKSIILCNSFWSTAAFAQTGSGLVSPMYQFTPGFVLKNLILSSFDSEGSSVSAPPVQEAVEFVTEQLETMAQGELASRLTLNCTELDCQGLKLSQEHLTIIDSLDKTARPAELKEELYAKYPDCKRAMCRIGGDFPFISAPDEVALYVEVHMRRVGVLVNKPQLDPSAAPQIVHDEGSEMQESKVSAKSPGTKAKAKPLFQD